MTYYIRTGDKVYQPFTIPLWSKILAGLFACYFFWITVEYVKMVYIQPEIARLEESTSAKYEVTHRIEALLEEIKATDANTDKILEAFKEEFPDEPVTYR